MNIKQLVRNRKERSKLTSLDITPNVVKELLSYISELENEVNRHRIEMYRIDSYIRELEMEIEASLEYNNV